MRRRATASPGRGAGAGLILLLVALTACTTGPVDHPKTVGLPYEEARRVIERWCPNAKVRVDPPGVLQAIDPSLLYVHSETYITPGRTTTPPPPPPEETTEPVVVPKGVAAQRFVAPTPSLEPCDTSVRNTVTLRLETTVPRVVDLSVGDARALLDKQGLQLNVPGNAAAEAAVVRSQNPAEGTRIEIDTVPHAKTPVTVEVAIRVPDLAEAAETAACRELDGLGLKCEPTYRGEGKPPGRVTSQEPPPGALVDPGAVVRLIVDLAPIPVQVPDVTGLTEVRACELLKKFELGCRADGPSDRELFATVAEQAPTAGEGVPPGSTVTITMAVRVPSVVDLDKGDACSALEKARLTCKPVETSGRGQPGQITRQDPTARSVVPMGTAVTVEFAPGVRVPDVRDAAGDAACGPIANAGLVCRTDPPPQGGRPGTVVDQNPAPGTLVAEGTEVVLVVQQEPDPGIPLWTLIAAAALLVAVAAAAAGVQQYRKRRPPGPPSVEVTLRSGLATVRAHEAREW